MAWIDSQREFIVESFFTNGDFLARTSRIFRNHLQLSMHNPVSDRKTILLWIKNVGATGSALKPKLPGRPRGVPTPENIQIVKESVWRSPNRSARKHSAASSLSFRNVRRILRSN